MDKIAEVLSEVVWTLKRTEQLSHCAVMSVLFAQNLELWNERKSLDSVRKTLIELREFNPADERERDAFDIIPYAVSSLKDLKTGKP